MLATYAFTKRAVQVLTLEDRGLAKIVFGDSDVPASREQTSLQGDNQIAFPLVVYRLGDEVYFSFKFSQDIPFDIKEMGIFNRENEMIFRGTFKRPLRIQSSDKYPQRFVFRLRLAQYP